MNKKLLFAFTILFLSFNLSAQTTGGSGTVQHRVVLQLSSNDTLVWKGLMNNIKNLKNGWGDSVLIEVVVHGPGIEFLTKGKTTQQERIAYFKSKGVVFVGCENTLTERKIPKENIIPEAGFVKMGVGEIILKQEQGWSYIKVGF
jgi:intracellular sulfur oxidation DsrE/DsrF family protein